MFAVAEGRESMSFSYARPEGDPRRRVSDIVIESVERERDRKAWMGFGLSVFFFTLWFGTLLLWAKYPWLLAGMSHLTKRVCN